MNTLRQILQQGLKLASKGNLKDALCKLEEGLKLRPAKGDERWVSLLYRNAGLIHEQNGNLRRAKKCYLDALKYSKPDPYIYYSLGDLSERLAQTTAAHRYFTRCRELAIQNQDQDLLEILFKRGYK